jgi:hypothetical protein
MSRATKLQEVRSYVDALLVKSPTMVERNTKFAILGQSDGDACLFNGLLGTVGVPMGIYAVLGSQGIAGTRSGMFYRSPRRRATDNQGFGAYFSRDMALGVLCAYSAPNMSDTIKAEFSRSKDAWLKWINNNRECLKKKPKWLGGGCWLRGPYRYAPDDRSLITPTMWAMMGRVWDYNGWGRHKEMDRWDKSDGDLSIIAAENNDLGYEVHLVAVQAYIKYLIGQSSSYSTRVGEILHDRIPENLFYEFLAKRKITDDMIDRYLDMKPSADKVGGNSWLWEKSDITQERIDKSCGWDFAFMGKLMLRHK